MSFFCILVSYAHIIVAIMEVPTACDRKKTFSTCSSYIPIIALLCETTIGVYLCSSSICTAVKEKASAVMCSAVNPC